MDKFAGSWKLKKDTDETNFEKYLRAIGVKQHVIEVMLIAEKKMNISIERDDEWELEMIPSSEKKEKINFKLNNSENSSFVFDEETKGGRDVQTTMEFSAAENMLVQRQLSRSDKPSSTVTRKVDDNIMHMTLIVDDPKTGETIECVRVYTK